MKALVLEDQGILTYKEVNEPKPFGINPVLLRIAAVGVCGSDVPRFSKGKAYHYPLILGHEFSAIVEEVPPGSKFAPGDRVTVFPLLPDHNDPLARIGEYAVSSGYDYFGSRRDGAFAERLYVPEENLIPIPDDVPLIHAAVVEPAAVALHAIKKIKFTANATGLVIGCGSVGAFAAQWLRILGCSQVYVAEVDQRKLAMLRNLGFDVIDARERDTVLAIKKLTGGRGADCTVEASGLPVTFLQAIEAAAVFGQVVLMGELINDVTLKASLLSSLIRRELTLYGTWNSKMTPPGKSEWEMVINHMRKDLKVSPLISHTPTLSEGPQMFADMANRNIWYNKVVFTVSEEAKAEAANLRSNI
jgi:L-iditol 2-dehydrogenase/galactitol-1-phosphate 5-dehydrogenase